MSCFVTFVSDYEAKASHGDAGIHFLDMDAPTGSPPTEPSNAGIHLLDTDATPSPPTPSDPTAGGGFPSNAGIQFFDMDTTPTPSGGPPTSSPMHSPIHDISFDKDDDLEPKVPKEHDKKPVAGGN